eukprot:m.103534 g.103534  ORF g.103534 m.103534 type:complete len:275 (+) comp27504_c0_seq1:114-938(+)
MDISASTMAELMKAMPGLGGKSLQPPVFHPVKWEDGQIFSMQDDPDRVTFPLALPDFLTTVNPEQRSTQTTVTDLTVPDMDSSSYARVVKNVFTESECADLIATINNKGFTPALLNIGHGRQVLAPSSRDGHRIIFDSAALTQWMFGVLKPHLPEHLEMDFSGKIRNINERCRFLCYTPGQVFPAHCDGRYTRSRDQEYAGDTSQITLQVYLHDVPEANGGATTFIDDSETKRLPYQPVAGSILMFSQDLYHEGSRVSAGVKYTMRTEVMYSHA